METWGVMMRNFFSICQILRLKLLAHLDGLAAKSHLASHAAKCMLLLCLAAKSEKSWAQKLFHLGTLSMQASRCHDDDSIPDKPVPLAKARLVQNNLGFFHLIHCIKMLVHTKTDY